MFVRIQEGIWQIDKIDQVTIARRTENTEMAAGILVMWADGTHTLFYEGWPEYRILEEFDRISDKLESFDY